MSASGHLHIYIYEYDVQGPGLRLINIYAGLTERGSLACRVCSGDRNHRCVVDDQKQEDKIGDRESSVGTAATGRMLARRGSTDAGSIPRPYGKGVGSLFLILSPPPASPRVSFQCRLTRTRAHAHIHLHSTHTHTHTHSQRTPHSHTPTQTSNDSNGTTWPTTPCDVV